MHENIILMFVPISYRAAFHWSLKSNKYIRQRDACYVFTKDDSNARQVKKQKASWNSKAESKCRQQKGSGTKGSGTKAGQREPKKHKDWERTRKEQEHQDTWGITAGPGNKHRRWRRTNRERRKNTDFNTQQIQVNRIKAGKRQRQEKTSREGKTYKIRQETRLKQHLFIPQIKLMHKRL